MQVATHILSGWCVANCFKLTPRERLFCMIAAAAPDVDGLGRLVSMDAYWKYHHVLGHNLLFCIVIAIVFACFSTHRLKAGVLYLALGHLHLLMDYFGSGPGWGIAYFWPFSNKQFKTDLAWEFFSWQNLTVAAMFLAWTVFIAVRLGRTPIEKIAPDLDKRFTSSDLKRRQIQQ